MPQPNKGTHGKPHVAGAMVGPAGSKPNGEVKFGAPGGTGTKGK